MKLTNTPKPITIMYTQTHRFMTPKIIIEDFVKDFNSRSYQNFPKPAELIEAIVNYTGQDVEYPLKGNEQIWFARQYHVCQSILSGPVLSKGDRVRLVENFRKGAGVIAIGSYGHVVEDTEPDSKVVKVQILGMNTASLIPISFLNIANTRKEVAA